MNVATSSRLVCAQVRLAMVVQGCVGGDDLRRAMSHKGER